LCDLQSFCSDHIIYVYFRGGYVNFSSDHSPDPTSNISDDWDDFLAEEEIFDDVIVTPRKLIKLNRALNLFLVVELDLSLKP